jgi:hypothetical protein
MFNRIGILSQGVLTSCGFSVTIVSDHGPGYLPVCSVVWRCVCTACLHMYWQSSPFTFVAFVSHCWLPPVLSTVKCQQLGNMWTACTSLFQGCAWCSPTSGTSPSSGAAWRCRATRRVRTGTPSRAAPSRQSLSPVSLFQYWQS